MYFNMKTKTYSLLVLLLFLSLPKAQLLITANGSPTTVPDASAVLQVVDDKRGVLLPRVPLLSDTDAVTVPTPVQGLMVFNTNTNKLNFWEAGKWNRNFGVADGTAIIKITENFSGASTASTANTVFPTTMPLFALNDSTTGWTSLGASTTITISKTTNTNYIITEGMVQINNDSGTDQEFQFAIGVFVNGQLKIARKFSEVGKNYVCNWKKFNLAGVFDDLPIGNYTVSVYGRNLPKLTSGYSSVTYGGNTSNCSNINNDMARIFVTAQVTQ